MRVLLDESVPGRLAGLLHPHEVLTVVQLGWTSISNGDLQSRAAGEFDVLITADRLMQHQQNVARFGVGVIVLVARRNRLGDYEPLLQALHDAIAKIEPGLVLQVRE